jgi:hypothetical protein
MLGVNGRENWRSFTQVLSEANLMRSFALGKEKGDASSGVPFFSFFPFCPFSSFGHARSYRVRAECKPVRLDLLVGAG